ncbi:MAG: site-2 protease family protein [Candidatus Peregrinibacteria bacterium]
MIVLLSALAFFFLLTVLILIHEIGHFAAARAVGVAVEEFGLGLPPRIKTLFRHGDTLFSLNSIPFGGFVRFRGEGAITETERRAPGSFSSVSILSRIIILVAGVTMNLLLALVLLTYGFSLGQWVPSYVTVEDLQAAGTRGEVNVTLGVLIESLLEDGGAAKAGVPAKSILSAIDGEKVVLPADVMRLQEGKQRVQYTVRSGEGWKDESTYTVRLSDGKSGVALLAMPLDLSAPVRSFSIGLSLALREVRVMTVQTILGLEQLFLSLVRTAKVPEGITGIVGIAQLTHDSVQQGLGMYLRLVAFISLSLAILNILPFPALDGGRLLFVFMEVIVRRPLNHRFEAVMNTLGFGILITLIAIITFNDVLRLFLG